MTGVDSTITALQYGPFKNNKFNVWCGLGGFWAGIAFIFYFRKYSNWAFVQAKKRHNLQTLQMERECKVKKQKKVQWISKKEDKNTHSKIEQTTNRQTDSDNKTKKKNIVIIRDQKRLQQASKRQANKYMEETVVLSTTKAKALNENEESFWCDRWI